MPLNVGKLNGVRKNNENANVVKKKNGVRNC